MDGYQKETIAQSWAFAPLPGEKNFFEKEKGRPLIWPTDGPFSCIYSVLQRLPYEGFERVDTAFNTQGAAVQDNVVIFEIIPLF